jgi:hypothetical protein
VENIFKVQERIAGWLVEIPTMVKQVPESNKGSNILPVTPGGPVNLLYVSVIASLEGLNGPVSSTKVSHHETFASSKVVVIFVVRNT